MVNQTHLESLKIANRNITSLERVNQTKTECLEKAESTINSLKRKQKKP